MGSINRIFILQIRHVQFIKLVALGRVFPKAYLCHFIKWLSMVLQCGSRRNVH